MTKPARTLELFGRPIGEWIFLMAMTVAGVNAVRNAMTDGFVSIGQAMVQAGNLVIGFSALGIVVATLAGRIFGVRLLWIFALALTFASPMATWYYGDPSVSEALEIGRAHV